ncbi:sulfurtransferase [Actinoplanes solisilvae]|uniref:sulfurtransferase n=1 Tax=Actinoplanes solisilvae TaxID=2486853 RepID=UPI000FDC16AC|nr:sulfurtransferase [Actinoplanes solisilvae]
MSRDKVLVDVRWAIENLNKPGIVFVEVDEITTAYETGHIDGAVRLDWKTDLQEKVRHDVVSPEGFASLMSERGIAESDIVVLYGGNNNWFAAFAYFIFKYYRHADVRIVDGGRKKWELDGLPMTTAVPDRPLTEYRVPEPDESIRAYRDEVVAAIGTKNLIDVRSPDEFAGRLLAPPAFAQEASQVPGHIPTACNVPWSKAANEDGTFKSNEELAKLYADAGLKDDKDTVVYCRIGERSSHSYFVLSALLDKKNVKNYDGSFSEYGSLIGVPVAIGDEPGEA